jgi:hypothetical protein
MRDGSGEIWVEIERLRPAKPPTAPVCLSHSNSAAFGAPAEELSTEVLESSAADAKSCAVSVWALGGRFDRNCHQQNFQFPGRLGGTPLKWAGSRGRHFHFPFTWCQTIWPPRSSNGGIAPRLGVFLVALIEPDAGLEEGNE